MEKIVLITGATGKQGGAVIDALLKADTDFQILALTRKADSPAAQRISLKSQKVKVISGNLDNVEAVFKAAEKAFHQPIWGVFSVQSAIGGGANPESEERQGKALVDASLKHNVKHFVYSSVDRGGDKSDANPTKIPHFKTKFIIEKHLFEEAASSEMGWTVLRPVAFYENMTPDFLGKYFSTSWKTKIGRKKTLQLVSTSDIGFLAAQAFSNPANYKDKKISIAGDELTYEEFTSIFREMTGQTMPTTFRFVAAFINWMVSDFGVMFKWFRDEGFEVDIDEVRKAHPGLKDFATWLETESQFKTK